mgnify:CR=1 FL=1
MGIAELALLGLALAMDAFAVSLSDMFCYRDAPRRRLFLLPIAFGLFQGLMPVLGYFLGSVFGEFIETYAGVVTFIILGLIGANMLKDGVCELRARKGSAYGDEGCAAEGVAAPDAVAGGKAADGVSGSGGLTLKVILMQAVATSIDAFAVGVSLRAESVDVAFAGAVIALITCACCFAALAVGRRAGDALGEKAQIAGGAVLIAIGVKALLF